MKKIFLLLTLSLYSLGYSQIHDPVSWSTSVEIISDTEYNLVITSEIEENWHLYSQKVPEGGPIATTFSFTKASDFELVGSTSEEEGHTVDDPTFGMEIKYFANKATFKQRIKVLTENSIHIVGEVEFMVCNDANCLPPTTVDLEFSIKGEIKWCKFKSS
jgi:thiol:disulfide interchange protein DsbD